MDYPFVIWGEERATFLAAGSALPPDVPVLAALVFAMSQGRFMLADIAGRGWCIPGGRLEAGETAEEAAHREVYEEIGAVVGPLHLLGNYLLTHAQTGARQLIPTYVARVESRNDLPVGTESQGVREATLEELPSCYFTWDPLMAAVFAAAHAVLPSE